VHELRNMLEVDTPLGWGHAILVADADQDTFWTVVLADSGAIVTFRQNQITACRNYTNGWKFSDAELRKIVSKGAKKR
jgi:hypothetical protein